MKGRDSQVLLRLHWKAGKGQTRYQIWLESLPAGKVSKVPDHNNSTYREQCIKLSPSTHVSAVAITQPRSHVCCSWCFEVLDCYGKCRSSHGIRFFSDALPSCLRGLRTISPAHELTWGKLDFSFAERVLQTTIHMSQSSTYRRVENTCSQLATNMTSDLRSSVSRVSFYM